MADVTNFPRETTVARLADAYEDNKAFAERQFDLECAGELDGTVATYRKTMRKWFIARGAATASAEELTALCEQWYTLTNPGWIGGTDFYNTDVSAVSTGSTWGDNVGLTCVPSTDTVEGQDDYAGNPFFAVTRVNWVLDSNGDRQITAVEGVSQSFVSSDPNVYVATMQMTPWVASVQLKDTYRQVYSSVRDCAYAVEPVSEAVLTDGTVSPFVLHGSYQASLRSDGALTCCAGVIPAGFRSHDNTHSAQKKNGANYSGTCACDIAWLQWQTQIIFKSLTLDGIVQGACNNSTQAYAQISENAVKRIYLPKSTAWEVGMSVLVGTYGSSADRGTAANYSISGNTGCLITAVETKTVDSTEYTVIYVDTTSTFDTVANGNATSGSTIVSTWHWLTGTSDKVLGNNGSIVSCTSGKYPARIQGIEFMNGAYTVLADAILNYTKDSDDNYWVEPWFVRTASKQASSVANYIASGLKLAQLSANNWTYIKRLAWGSGMFFPCEVGGSSSTYTRDAAYILSATVGLREWRCCGYLDLGSAYAGVSCWNGDYALSYTRWSFGVGLSPNGNRGEWVA